MKPQLHLLLFGAPQFIYQDIPLTGFISNKARGLLIYLAVTGRTHSRDALAELLWAETPATKRNNLKKALNNLRKLEGVELIEEGHHNVTLAPKCYWLDINAFLAKVETSLTDQSAHKAITAAEETMALYQADFLDGFNISLSLEFEEWVLSVRTELKMQMLDLLNRLADGYEEQNLLPKAITALRHLLKIEPWQEDKHRKLIQLLATHGDTSGALAQFENCRTSLLAELDVEPGSATVALVEQIRNGNYLPTVGFEPQEAGSIAKRPAQNSESKVTTRRLSKAQATISKTKVDFPLIEREKEWQVISHVWQALEGSHFISISGEAGIGKTRLAEELLQLAERENAAVARTRSHQLQGQLAFGPIADWLRSAPLQSALEQLDEGWQVEIARLLPELLGAGMAPPQPMKEGWQRKRFFDALIQLFLLVEGPLLLVLDDLQWTDTDTLEWLQYLIESSLAPILLVGTVRGNELSTDHTLHRVQQQLRRLDRLTEVHLSELSAEATNQLAATVINSSLEERLTQRLFDDTAGNPLFIIETMRVEAADPVQVHAGSSLPSRSSFSIYPQPETTNNALPIPPKMYSVIQSRLGQVSPQAQELAQLGATIGRAFDVTLLSQAASSDENVVLILLDELWQRRIIKEVDAVHFDFSHDRIRDVAYAEIGPFKQRLLHRNVAEAIKGIYQDRLDHVYGQLATHYEYAGDAESAIGYYQRAASVASGLNSYREKINSLAYGINLIRQLSNRGHFLAQELSMLQEQSDAYVAIEGFASPRSIGISNELLALAEDAQNDEARYHAFCGLRVAYAAQGKLSEAEEYAAGALAVAEKLYGGFQPEQSATARERLANAHNNLAAVHFHVGDLRKAWPHFEEALSLDWPNAFARSHHACWLLGYPDKASGIAQEGLAKMRSQGDAYHLSWALLFAAMLDFLLRDFSLMKSHYEEAQTLAHKYDFAFVTTHSHFFEGWALAASGNRRGAISLFKQGIAGRESLENKLFQPLWNIVMIDGYIKLDEHEKARRLTKSTLREAHQSNEGFLNAELHRILGDLESLQPGCAAGAEEQYQTAIRIASQQSAKSLELRSMISLAKLWTTQNKVRQARHLLSTCFEGFTEGYTTKDLQAAKELLKQFDSTISVHRPQHSVGMDSIPHNFHESVTPFVSP